MGGPYNDGGAMVETPHAYSPAPITKRFEDRKNMPERELKQVNEALGLLKKNEDLQKLFDAVTVVGI